MSWRHAKMSAAVAAVMLCGLTTMTGAEESNRNAHSFGTRVRDFPSCRGREGPTPLEETNGLRPFPEDQRGLDGSDSFSRHAVEGS